MKAYHVLFGAAILLVPACFGETVNPVDHPEDAGCGVGGGCPDGQKVCGDLCVTIDTRANGFWWDCDGVPANGCEVDAFTDPHNCGYCGNDCSAGHMLGVCERGYCSGGECQSGWYDCDGDKATGCESDSPCRN